MANVSVEQALRSQVKFDIGDDENMTFKQKNMLLQKYGITPAVLTSEELAYLTTLENPEVDDDYEF
jgi:hypothetical protein